jgi:hypothetical protein
MTLTFVIKTSKDIHSFLVINAVWLFAGHAVYSCVIYIYICVCVCVCVCVFVCVCVCVCTGLALTAIRIYFINVH